MRLIFLTCLLILSACAQWVRMPASATPERHVVFDIDWTITSELKSEKNFQKKSPRIIEVEGKKYFIQDGVEEFVENLLSHTNVKISFFSGGPSSRNRALLSSIHLSDGRSLADIAYKILSRDDLYPVPGVPETEKFYKRFKKDLSKVSPDLSQLVMIDDTDHFVLGKAQEEHVVWLGKTYEHFDSFQEASSEAGEYVPKTESEWSFARKKMMILDGAFELALRESEERGLPFSEAVRNQVVQLDLARSDWNDYSQKMHNLSRSLAAKKRHVTSSAGCVQLISPFLAP